MTGYQLRTKSGLIWGSPEQKAAVKKAAEASARARRKNRPDPQDRRDRSTSGPSVAEVMANPHGYPSREAHTTAIIEAKRRERLAAGHGPAVIPKGQALGGDGKLHDATNRMDIPKKAPTLESERIQQRIDDYKKQLETPDSSIDGKRHMHLRNAIKESTRQLRVAKGNEETAQSNAALAQQRSTPEGRAAQDAFEERNRNRAALADLRKKVATLPAASFAGRDAAEKLDRLEKRLGLAPGETPPALPRPGAAAPEAKAAVTPDQIRRSNEALVEQEARRAAAPKRRRMSEGKAVHYISPQGAKSTGTITDVYDRFYNVRLSTGQNVTVDFDEAAQRLKSRRTR